MNTSKLSDYATARTNIESSQQRAENIYILRCKNVLELCCGASLKVLEKSYKKLEISCTGNDIEERWRNYYEQGNWLMGNCLQLDLTKFDCIVFAPPVTEGCTGKRIDSLSIEQVNPSYYDFIDTYKHLKKTLVLVLPSRSIATNYDRKQYYKLLDYVSKYFTYSVIGLTEGRRKIRKYVDVYLTPL